MHNITSYLINFSFALQLMPETLFLTVNLIDRFLEIKQVTRRNLQLVSALPDGIDLHLSVYVSISNA